LKALSILEKSFGEDNIEIVDPIVGLAMVNMTLGNFLESSKFLDRAKRVVEHTVGENHYKFGLLLGRFGDLYKEQNRISDAESFYTRALNNLQQFLGKDHDEVADMLSNLAICYALKNKKGAAKQLFLESRTIIQKVFGDEHPKFFSIRNNLIKFNLDN